MSAGIRSFITLISPSCVNNNATKVNDIDKVDREAGEECARKKRPRFGEMNIPIEMGTQCVPNVKLVIKTYKKREQSFDYSPSWSPPADCRTN